jgi:hypothetical protein
MSDDKNSGVDPRFDAAFQRGFDQSVPIEEYVPPPQPRKSAVAESAAPASASSSFAPAPEKVAPRPGPAASPRTPRAAPISSAEPDLVVVAGAEDVDERPAEADADADSDSNPSRNPFLLFLGIIAVALVAAGIWLFVRSGEAFNSAEVRSQGDYMSLDATIHMAPFIALLGGATAIGILFVFAAKYRRR